MDGSLGIRIGQCVGGRHAPAGSRAMHSEGDVAPAGTVQAAATQLRGRVAACAQAAASTAIGARSGGRAGDQGLAWRGRAPSFSPAQGTRRTQYAVANTRRQRQMVGAVAAADDELLTSLATPDRHRCRATRRFDLRLDHRLDTARGRGVAQWHLAFRAISGGRFSGRRRRAALRRRLFRRCSGTARRRWTGVDQLAEIGWPCHVHPFGRVSRSGGSPRASSSTSRCTSPLATSSCTTA